MKKNINTTNGDIKLKLLSKVGGNIQSINGKITLMQAQVEGKVTLANGDIILQQGAHIQGDIIMGNDKHDPLNDNPLLPFTADFCRFLRDR